ncbi:MAG: hypothetical protein LBK99_24260 [Opitutaceae bacterium]|nr:hypothetical protein [Opitutaceae bacterium]
MKNGYRLWKPGDNNNLKLREAGAEAAAAAFLPLRRGAKRLASCHSGSGHSASLEPATLRVVAAVWRPPLQTPSA